MPKHNDCELHVVQPWLHSAKIVTLRASWLLQLVNLQQKAIRPADWLADLLNR